MTQKEIEQSVYATIVKTVREQFTRLKNLRETYLDVAEMDARLSNEYRNYTDDQIIRWEYELKKLGENEKELLESLDQMFATGTGRL